MTSFWGFIMTNALLIHIHVPKCAGTTVEKHFRRELGDVGFWRPPKRTRKLPLELLGYKYDPTLPGPSELVRAISGHFAGRSMARLFPGRRIVRSIVLREPESLMLSWYNFRIMRYLIKGHKPYSFSLFMRAMRMNPVAHFLLTRWAELPLAPMALMPNEKKASILDGIFASLDHVVDISETDTLIASLSRQIGIRDRAPRHNTAEEKQRLTGWKVIGLDDLSEQERLLLKTRTSLDRYLWRRWALKENVAFDRSGSTGFLVSELVRPSYQIQRHAIQRFG